MLRTIPLSLPLLAALLGGCAAGPTSDTGTSRVPPQPLPAPPVVGASAAPSDTAAAAAVPAVAATADPDRVLPAASALALPAGYALRLDRPNASADDFRAEPTDSGLIVTTGPAGILYQTDAAHRLSGDYTVTATIQQLEPSQHPEAYGIFIGGQDLQGERQRYIYFLVRQDGHVLIKQRLGTETPTLLPWTETPAFHATGAGPAENTLTIRVADDGVVFLVNDAEVARIPRDQLQTDGVVGYRVNHNLHVRLGPLRITQG